jgi:hypothetical protein
MYKCQLNHESHGSIGDLAKASRLLADMLDISDIKETEFQSGLKHHIYIQIGSNSRTLVISRGGLGLPPGLS